MPRANRYFIPGHIWHVTHRCHNREFLFKQKKDRQEWVRWLYECQKRFHVSVLNYIVTCNHIHLLVRDDSHDRAVSRFMQLMQSRTAQLFNERENRKGAFWEDRYHATAVESGDHLRQCITYIDLNMVRAGEVKDPAEWRESGFYEIQLLKNRKSIIDYSALLGLLKIDSIEQLNKVRREWAEKVMACDENHRDGKWTEAVAVGSVMFLENFKKELRINGHSKEVRVCGDDYILSDYEIPYRNIIEEN